MKRERRNPHSEGHKCCIIQDGSDFVNKHELIRGALSGRNYGGTESCIAMGSPPVLDVDFVMGLRVKSSLDLTSFLLQVMISDNLGRAVTSSVFYQETRVCAVADQFRNGDVLLGLPIAVNTGVLLSEEMKLTGASA